MRMKLDRQDRMSQNTESESSTHISAPEVMSLVKREALLYSVGLNQPSTDSFLASRSALTRATMAATTGDEADYG